MADEAVGPGEVKVESPPASELPAKDEAAEAPKEALNRMAAELMRTQNRRLMIEFLKLRRAMR